MGKKFKSDFEGYLKLMIKSSAIIFFAILLSKVLTYIYRIIIARYYGPEVYGLFSLALMVAGFVGALASFGLIEGLLRYVSLYRGQDKPDWIRYLVRFSFLILFISSFFAGILLFIFSEYLSIEIFHNPSLIVYIKIFSALLPISVISNFFLNILRAYEKVGWYSFIFNVIQNVLKVVTLGLLIWIGVNGTATAWSQFIATAGVLLVSFIVARITIKEIWGKSNLRKGSGLRRSLISYSWPIIISSVVYTLFYWVDTFFLGYYTNAKSVGIYNVAIPIAALLTFAPELFMQLFLPLVTKEEGRKRKEMVSQISKQISKWIFAINIPVFLLIFAFPGAIINLIFGSEYLVAENALRLLSIGALFTSTFAVSKNLINVVGKTKLILINSVIATIINVILNWKLIPIYGISGAAFSTMISSILLSFAFFLESIYLTKVMPIRRKIINLFVAATIAFLIMNLIKPLLEINLLSIFVLSSLFGLIYLLLALLFKSLDEYDLDMISLIKNKLKRSN